MTSRCITYKWGGCLIEEFATEATPDAPHVARVYFVDRADEGAIVRPIIDLEGRPILDTRAVSGGRDPRRAEISPETFRSTRRGLAPVRPRRCRARNARDGR